MLTEAFPGGAPRDHELAISRLENLGRDLRSPVPPPTFNPRNFTGIELLRVAARNLETQHRVNRSIGVVQERLEASLRFAALRSIEQQDSEPKVFDSFTAGDISQLTFFYGAFHQNIGRVLGSEVMPIEDVRALAEKHEEAIPKIPPSRAIVSQRRESVIDKLQDWLVDPNIDQKMEQLLPVDNEGDDVWLFMDSIRTLDGQLGLKHGVNVKDFFRRNLEALGKHTYSVDFSKRGNGVVVSGNNAPVDEVKRPIVEEVEQSESQSSPGPAVTVIYRTESVNTSDVAGLNNDTDTQPEAAPVVSIEPLVPKPKAVEQRNPDIRLKLGEFLDDVMGRPEFSAPVNGMALNRVFQALKRNVLTKILEQNVLDVPADRDGHARYDVPAIVTILYLHNIGSQLPSQLKKQVQDIAIAEHRKKLEAKKDPS